MTRQPLKLVFACALVGLALVIPAAFAAYTGEPSTAVQRAHVPQGYFQSTVSEAYRTGLDGGESVTEIGDLDSTSDTTAAGITSLSCAGRQAVTVSTRHSVASATVELTIAAYEVDSTTTAKLRHMSTVTLTGDGTYTADGGTTYPSTQAFTFDTGGCDVVKVFAADPSSGTVDIWAEVH